MGNNSLRLGSENIPLGWKFDALFFVVLMPDGDDVPHGTFLDSDDAIAEASEVVGLHDDCLLR